MHINTVFFIFEKLIFYKMKKIYLQFVFILTILSTITANAQTYNDKIKEDIKQAANIYYPYHHENCSYTKPPRGYRPFYISHYGRHGSRYHSSAKYFSYALQTLHKADSANILTSDGKDVLKQIEILDAAHYGMAGELSQRGAKEHRDISERMFENFSPVFLSKNRNIVRCVSSPYSRCLMSMANFTNVLKGNNPDLSFDFTTGERYFSYICNIRNYDEWAAPGRKKEDSLRTAMCKYEKLFSTLFNDRQKAGALCKYPHKFIESVYMAGAICGDLDFLNLDIFKYFDPEELALQGFVNNVKTYCMMGNSKEMGEYSCNASKNLVKDFVEKADSAIVYDTKIAADLRFGHDTGILPFLNCIGVKGMESRKASDDPDNKWFAFEKTPMGTNFQMIFYKNRNNDILVKLLYNEKETAIPAISQCYPSFYNWNDLKGYLKSLYLEN